MPNSTEQSDGATDSRDWSSPIPEAAEAFGVDELTVGVDTLAGQVTVRDAPVTGGDVGALNGRVTVGLTTDGEPTGHLGLRLTPEQAHAWAEALARAADDAAEERDADVI